MLVQEPGSKYVGHITPISGKAQDILGAINNCPTMTEDVWKSITAIGSDGTAVNTGRYHSL